MGYFFLKKTKRISAGKWVSETYFLADRYDNLEFEHVEINIYIYQIHL